MTAPLGGAKGAVELEPSLGFIPGIGGYLNVEAGLEGDFADLVLLDAVEYP